MAKNLMRSGIHRDPSGEALRMTLRSSILNIFVSCHSDHNRLQCHSEGDSLKNPGKRLSHRFFASFHFAQNDREECIAQNDGAFPQCHSEGDNLKNLIGEIEQFFTLFLSQLHGKFLGLIRPVLKARGS